MPNVGRMSAASSRASSVRRSSRELGLETNVAQANMALSVKRGTLRGMHFQYPPATEAKLVRCLHGAVIDVIVDLRPESATYLQHVAVELSSDLAARALRSRPLRAWLPDIAGRNGHSLSGKCLLRAECRKWSPIRRPAAGHCVAAARRCSFQQGLQLRFTGEYPR